MTVELRTRIATQALPFRNGDESRALASVYELFGVFRDLAKAHPGANHFFSVGERVFNRRLRPFTAQWHPVDKSGHLGGTDTSFHFRTQLLEVQAVLRKFDALLESIAGIPSTPERAPGTVNIDGNLAESFEIEVVQDDDQGSLAALVAKELVDIRRRRERRVTHTTHGPYEGDTADGRVSESGERPSGIADGVGLALSGGGIRSATFAMGVVTELARRGLMEDVDYMSTVSGGGYLGSFITSTVGAMPKDEKTPFKAVFGAQNGAETAPVRAVRNHSKYLVEGGIKTLATIAGTVFYGLVTSVLLVAPAVLVALALTSVIEHSAAWAWFLGTSGVLLLLGGYVGAQCKASARPPSQLVRWFAVGGIGCIFTLAACLFALPTDLYLRGVRGGAVFALLLAATCIAALASPRLRPYAADAVFWASAIAAGVVLLAAGTHPALNFFLLLVTSALLFVVGLAVNLNTASPHPFYKERLSKAYLLNAHGRPFDQTQPLSAINASGCAPYHLMCAAVNAPSSTNPELRGRLSDFFLLSKHGCGSLLCGYTSTKEWRLDDGTEIDLATAMAISGAAASPNMGRHSVRAFGYALALLNLRLGYWLRRPGRTGWLMPHAYYWREMRQSFEESLPFLNVSDGGHIENLGVFELLRRSCRFIIAVDGEADPQRSFEGLLHVVHLARVDLNVRIDPRLDRLRADADGVGRSHFEMFRVVYPGERYGVLLYLKASLTGNEPETILRYRAEHPEFPHESTSKQLYSEHQFEAYRLLGEHIASDLFHEALVGKHVSSIGKWLQQLAGHFLPSHVE